MVERITEDRPVVIVDREGRFLDLARQNEKGYAKSLETHQLWVVHPGTGRLLPFREDAKLSGIEQAESCNIARLDTAAPTADSAPWTAPQPCAEPKPPPAPAGDVLSRLAAVITERKRLLPSGSYTTHLFNEGPTKIRKKTGEEAVELILAVRPEEVVHEAADLLYHLMVLLEAEGIGLQRLLAELENRAK